MAVWRMVVCLMIKVTYTVDEQTVARIRTAAVRFKTPQSQIVREAVRLYAEHTDRLMDEERRERVRRIKAMIARPPTRSAKQVDAELAEIRAARRLSRRPSDRERRRR